MNYSQSFISLEFDKEDSDLWGALQLIEPGKRSAFIKGALRCTLVAGLSPEYFYSEGASLLIENLRINSLAVTKTSEEDHIQGGFDEVAVQKNSSIDETRVVSDQSGSLNESLDLSYHFATEEKVSDRSEMQSNSNLAPWEHLLYNIIGVEEDEAILNVLNKTSISPNMLNEVSLSTEDITNEETELMDNENLNLMMQDFNLEDLKVNTETVQSIGVDYVLKQVIGEETDAEIIELLQSGELLTST